jgi:hypothetical protein
MMMCSQKGYCPDCGHPVSAASWVAVCEAMQAHMRNQKTTFQAWVSNGSNPSPDPFNRVTFTLDGPCGSTA